MYPCCIYPLFLILLTWVCIKLYDRGFKPIVCVVVTFHKFKFKQDWGDKRDVMDVFSAFFLLSYIRLLHQSSLFLVWDKVSYIHDSKPGVWGIKYIMNYDYNITYGSSKHIAITAVSLLIILVFNVLPALLLVLYPLKIIRACLSKYHLDTLCLSTFMDKFHGCYRNGLNGGRDMRSFAGLYVFIRCLFFSTIFVNSTKFISPLDPIWFYYFSLLYSTDSHSQALQRNLHECFRYRNSWSFYVYVQDTN